MWPRTVEIMLGFWLAVSPFVFSHPLEESFLWWNDLVTAFFIITISLFSFWGRTRRAHLLNLVVAAWLMAFGYFGSPEPPPPSYQNDLVIGILLLMFSIIPGEASLPPRQWRREPDPGV